MKQHNYYRYFRVFKNDTVVKEISTNDFLQLKHKSVNWHNVTFSFPINEPLFCGYIDHAKALEMAKAGALEHINALIAMGKDGELALYEYRFHHYEDLTVNLCEANIKNSL